MSALLCDGVGRLCEEENRHEEGGVELFAEVHIVAVCRQPLSRYPSSYLGRSSCPTFNAIARQAHHIAVYVSRNIAKTLVNAILVVKRWGVSHLRVCGVHYCTDRRKPSYRRTRERSTSLQCCNCCRSYTVIMGFHS